MQRKGLIRNLTGISQNFGVDTIPSHAIGLIDFEVIKCFKERPNKDFEVIDDSNFIFVRTPHVPFNNRYKSREQQ